jgi:hypothetical protein
MGDVVFLSQIRRLQPRRGHGPATGEFGTIALFTGVRIERWPEPRPALVEPAPESAPTTPRRRRRRRD